MNEIPESFPMLAQLLNSDEMTQQVSPSDSINVIELFADFAERSVDAVMAILTSINFASLKRISFRAQRQHRAPLLRLWVCIAAFDYHVHEDLMQNLFTFLVSFLRPDAEPPATDDDLTRAEFLLCLACHENDLARVKCRENGMTRLITKHLHSDSWSLRRWTCLLLSQLCYESSMIKKFLYNDSALADIMRLLTDPFPEVRASALYLLESFVGFLTPDATATTGSIHEYLTREDIETLVNQEDPSLQHDQNLLDGVSKRILMNKECSVLVRRELFRLILKVFCRRCHLAHMICFVDRVLKNKLDVSTLLEHVETDGFSHAASGHYTQFYMKYWIMFLSLRDAEPHLAIRKAAAHYVNVVCKNVDNLKNTSVLPATPSIFDFSALLQLERQHRGSIPRQTSFVGLPTVQSSHDVRRTSAELPVVSSPRHRPSLGAMSPAVPVLSTGGVGGAAIPALVTGSVAPLVTGATAPALVTGSAAPALSTGPALPTIPPLSTGSAVPLPINSTTPLPTGPTNSTTQPTPRARSPLKTTSTDPPVRATESPRQLSHSHSRNSRGGNLIPPAIATSPSFSSLQLLAQSPEASETSHIDSWLNVQLGLVGLPDTLMEWSINSFLQRPTQTVPMEPIRCDVRYRAAGNELEEYALLRRSVRTRPISPLKQKDVFYTNGATITCLSFHPFFDMLAIGMNNSVIFYDYNEQRQIYSVAHSLPAASTDFAWINASSSALLVEATEKGVVYVWDVPRLDQKRQPRTVSSFLAFPVFAKEGSRALPNPRVVVDWSQETGLLACAGSTQLVKVWDMEQERLVCCKETGFATPVVSVKSHGEFMHYCGLYDGHVISMDTRCKEVANVFECEVSKGNRIVSMVSRDSNSLVLGDFAGTLHTLDLRNQQEVASRHLLPYLSCVQTHPLLPLMAASSLNSELLLLREEEPFQSIRTLKGFRATSLGNLQSVALHPCSSTVATFNRNGVVYLFSWLVCFSKGV